jgi:hypothetical protein
MISPRGRKRAGSKGIRKTEQRNSAEWGYLIIWEFQVRPEMAKRFEKIYGADGEWARLFLRDGAYIGTELIHHFNASGSYVTLDFWTSEKAYDDFRNRHLAEYEALDKKCETLTENEREIGKFVRVSSK